MLADDTVFVLFFKHRLKCNQNVMLASLSLLSCKNIVQMFT